MMPQLLLPVKIISAKSGEVRRWPGHEDTTVAGAFQTASRHLDQISTAMHLELGSMCLTYVDNEGDVVMIPTCDKDLARQELLEAHRLAKEAGNKALALTVHRSKSSALKWLNAQKRSYECEEDEDDVSALGPHAGRIVALDLRVPVAEAEELVRRASAGDEIARRVVLPSKSYLSVLIAAKKLNVLYDESAFRDELGARGVLTVDKPVHWGVACDASEMCPIVGTRYHLKGQDYDLCEAEYAKLDPSEQAKFVAIDKPLRYGVCRDAPEPPPEPLAPPVPPASPAEPPQVDDPPPAYEPPASAPAVDSDDELVVVSAPRDVDRARDDSLDEAVSHLESMGFTDEATSRRLLESHGSLEKVVEALVDQGQPL